MNTRQTRGAENRKQTTKYAEFKSKTKKEVELESAKSINSESEADDSNGYNHQDCSQSSCFQKAKRPAFFLCSHALFRHAGPDSQTPNENSLQPEPVTHCLPVIA